MLKQQEAGRLTPPTQGIIRADPSACVELQSRHLAVQQSFTESSCSGPDQARSRELDRLRAAGIPPVLVWLQPLKACCRLQQAGCMMSITAAGMLRSQRIRVWRTRPASPTLPCLYPLPGPLCVRARPGWVRGSASAPHMGSVLPARPNTQQVGGRTSCWPHQWTCCGRDCC